MKYGTGFLLLAHFAVREFGSHHDDSLSPALSMKLQVAEIEMLQ